MVVLCTVILPYMNCQSSSLQHNIAGIESKTGFFQILGRPVLQLKLAFSLHWEACCPATIWLV